MDRSAGLRYNRGMKFPEIEDIEFEENNERLKITLPVKRNWILFGIYSIVMLVCLGLMVSGLMYTARIAFSGERFAIVFTIMLLLLLAILFYFMRFVWHQWQFYASPREILFINKEMLIVRRPVSILGITDAYDMQYVKPMVYDPKYRGVSFQYGSQPRLFALGLAESQVAEMVAYVNGRFFPAYDDDDED